MADESVEVKIERLFGKIGQVEQVAKSAHKRSDENAVLIKEQMADIKTMIKELSEEMRSDMSGVKRDTKEVHDWMNRGKGWAAASLLLAGLVGSIVATIIKSIGK